MSLAGTASAQPRAQDDFYTHINHEWLESTPIPDDLPGLDNFTVLTLKAYRELWDDLEELRKSKKPLASHQQKLVDLHLSFNDQKSRNELGARALKSELKLIADAKDHNALGIAFARIQMQGVGGPLLQLVMTDPKNSSRHTVIVQQWGLELTQATLVGDDDRSQKQRELYREHVANMFTLIDLPDAKKRAARVVELERDLAKIQWTPTQNRNPQKTYNLYTSAQLSELLSNFPVAEMHESLGYGSDIKMVVKQPTYFEALNELFPRTELEVWRDYLRLRVLLARAVLLSQDFQDELNAYEKKRGLATTEMEPWLKTAIFLGEEVNMLAGRFYVERHFSDDALSEINDLVKIIKEEYRVAISGSTLFSEATKKEALEKLAKMRFQIGCPKKWKDYSTLKIDPKDLIGNVNRIARFDHLNMAAKLNEPVDPDEWVQSPIMVNAAYDPLANKFIVLAAILQDPFFETSWSKPTNLGGIGFIISHEIGHGFDDQGSQYDAVGNLRNWWTKDDREKFNAVAQRAVKQANAYEILPDHKLNGPLELGEILGDLNGLHIAHRACVRHAKANGVEPDEASREFFAQAAKVWRSTLREPVLLKRLETDPHPPSKYRVNGIFPHLDAFHELYKTKPGDGMYLPPEERLKIW